MTDSCNLICWASSTLSDFQLAAASYPATNQKCAAPIFTGSAANSQLLQIYFCTRWLCPETCGYLFPVAQTASFKGKKKKKAVWAHADSSAAPLLFHTDRQTRLFLTVWSCSCLIYWLTSGPDWAELDGLLALLLLQLDTRILMWSVPRACL